VRWFGVALAALTACGGDTSPRCASPEQVLASVDGAQMACADVERVANYRHWMMQQRVSDAQTAELLSVLVRWFEREPAQASTWLSDLSEQLAVRQRATGMEGALVHASALYEVNKGVDLWERADDSVRSNSAQSLLIWASDGEAQRVLTEPAIEAWIRYISLCRQVQGGGSLNLSVSDRAKIYGVFKDRFLNGDASEREATVGFGPYWPEMEAAWQAARYTKQQQWIAEAPLPPPVTSTSLGYVEWFLDHGRLKDHVVTFHRVLGPLSTEP